jgi:hypothetical protein
MQEVENSQRVGSIAGSTATIASRKPTPSRHGRPPNETERHPKRYFGILGGCLGCLSVTSGSALGSRCPSRAAFYILWRPSFVLQLLRCIRVMYSAQRIPQRLTKNYPDRTTRQSPAVWSCRDGISEHFGGCLGCLSVTSGSALGSRCSSRAAFCSPVEPTRWLFLYFLHGLFALSRLLAAYCLLRSDEYC